MWDAFGNDLERQEADPASQGNLLIKGRPQMGEEHGKFFGRDLLETKKRGGEKYFNTSD